MKCLSPADVAYNFLDAVARPLAAQIDSAYKWVNQDNDVMLQPFQYGAGWMESEPYCDMRFEYEYFNGSFVQICNMIQMIGGQAFEEEFITVLTEQMIEHVELRIVQPVEVKEEVAA